jgi:hypothetical protein
MYLLFVGLIMFVMHLLLCSFISLFIYYITITFVCHAFLFVVSNIN